MFSLSKKIIILSLISVGIIIPSCVASERLHRALDLKAEKPITEVEEPTETPDPPVEPPVIEDLSIKCESCSPVEQHVLKFFQDYGIKDRNSLAVLMANIRQESKFNTLICEGGQLTGYHRCHRGGFGLVQWTTSSRYYGLGRHSTTIGKDPNTIEAQLSWLVNEVEWKYVESRFKQEGQSVDYYMNAAWQWLRWGVTGPRVHYANQYLSQFN